MIPKISDLPQLDPIYAQYLNALKVSAFKGDVESAHASRLLVATDNSVYQRMPQGVIFPKDNEDISIALKLRATPVYERLIITPRGGGTGTNGQSLNDGITIDCSRYMKATSNFDADKREIYAQSGVIKDELNEFLKPIKERRKQYEENPELVKQILDEGTEVARKRAKENMKKVKEAMKIDY